jgi:hypothetical protein
LFDIFSEIFEVYLKIHCPRELFFKKLNNGTW